MHLNSKLLFLKHASSYFRDDLRILEISPDASPSSFHSMLTSKTKWETAGFKSWVHVDYTMTDEYKIPLDDNQIDIVLSSNVIENVKKPWRWMPELARICKPNGYVITINPVSWPYHEGPIDGWRIYPEGAKALAEDSGLTVILSVFEALEEPGYKRYLPGRNKDHQGKIYRWVSRILGRCVGWPVEVAYDTITISQKLNP